MNPLRIGLLGVRAGQPYLEAIRQRDDLVVVALCDRETDPLAAAARAYAVDLAVTSDQRLWCSKLDAVLIAGPERLHRKHIMGALEAGAHVFCVGPLAGFGSDASRLVAQAEGYPDQRVMVGQPLRFHPLFAAISQLLASGRLGEIYAVRVSQWAAAEAWPGDDPTRAEAAGGTPPLLAVGHQALDLAFWLGGSPVTVSATGSQRVLLRQPFDDTVCARFQTADRAILEVFVAVGARRPPAVGLEILGTRGSVSAATDRDDNHFYEVAQGQLTQHALPAGTAGNGLAEALAEFVAAIREERPPAVGLADGARAVTCALAALEAARTGAPIALDPTGR